MKKRVMRVLAVVGVMLTMATVFAGCSKKTECDLCGETAKCKKLEDGYFCDKCYDLAKDAADLADMLGM